ncbi:MULTISPECIES: hypothetical protein [Streptomyces]|nr:hypothetical protein [Streptomyces sp. ME02-6978.2a]MDX3359763.1 hypothetical protein [Streptomyces sp. ME02-6978.2a]WTI27535.1 hypothetical protein OHA67_14920 [Streptomyces jietaisiensis]
MSPEKTDTARSTITAGIPTNACKGREDGKWYANRTSQCLIAPALDYTLWDDGKIVGTAVFAVAQEIDLSVTSLTWTETDQVALLEATNLAQGLRVNWTTQCAGTCSSPTVEPWPMGTPITVGQTLKSTYSLSDVPTTVYDYLDQSYSLSVSQPNSTILTSANWGGVDIRCDDSIAITNSAGCIIPGHTPTFDMSRLLYGSSADMISWAQINLARHWGLPGSGQPLHRLQKSTEQRKNRTAICGASKFVPDPGIPDDSCDEFPFAGTYESAALNGVDDGRNCAQTTAVNTGSSGYLPADWATIIPIGAHSGTEACVRGHIPSSLNSDAGGGYGNFVKAARLADGDPFWLNVVS